MNDCFMLKANGQPCTARAWRGLNDTHPDHLHFCGTHKPVYRRIARDVGVGAHPPQLGGPPPVHHTAGRCLETVKVWDGMPLRQVIRWCPNNAIEGSHLCAEHRDREAARAQRAAARAERLNIPAIVHTLVHALLETEPMPRWREAVTVLAAMNDVPLAARWRAARAYYNTGRVRREEVLQWRHAPRWRLERYWAWVIGGRQGPEPDLENPPVLAQAPLPPAVPRAANLGTLARDSQNVHTRVVTDQTNTATNKLLTVVVPETQQTEKTMTLVWLGILNIAYGSYLRVAQDVNRWFNTKDCRATGDNLYRRLLRGLVATLAAEKDDERRTEMYRRLWEECHEAVGMCCEGHISRLCNVLVGFDEAFQPPVPFGEILQSKMAAIAGLDVSDEEKRKQANAFFDEHGTPQEERVAWLDAF